VPFVFLCGLNIFGVAVASVRKIDCACMNQIKEKKKQLRDEILQYLIAHPKAQDTVTGIVTWWFLERTIKPRTTLVEEVLKELANDGLVIARKGSDSQTRYKMNRRRRKDIILLLQQKS
jgi:hypothetical protein